MSAVLEARGVRKTYRGGDNELVEVLNHVDVEVARGEVVAIVGASGAGKRVGSTGGGPASRLGSPSGNCCG